MAHAHTKFKFRLRTIFVITTVIAILLAWWCAQMSWFDALLVGKTGPVTSRDDWPKPLKELLDGTKELQLDESSIQVHCLGEGFDPEFVWRMDAAPGLFEHVKQRWNLTPISKPQWPILKRRSPISARAAPPWWSLKDDGNTDFFVSPQELAKEKGDRFQVARDRKRNKIFVRYWFNF